MSICFEIQVNTRVNIMLVSKQPLPIPTTQMGWIRKNTNVIQFFISKLSEFSLHRLCGPSTFFKIQ